MTACVSQTRSRAAARIGGAFLMLGLLVFLGVAAVCFPAHAMVCPEAGQPDDHCAVAQFAAGLAEAPACPPLTPCPPPAFALLPPSEGGAHPCAPLFWLSPSRAPPAAFQVR